VTLVGLSPATFAAIAIAASAFVIALYLLKLRRPRVVVPFAQLWQAVFAEGEHRTLFDRLRKLLSLLMQLVLVMLLVTALADPRPATTGRAATRTVLVLDGSASMMARDTQGRAAFDVMLADVRSLAGSVTSSGEAAAVLAGADVEPLTAFTDDPAELVAGLARAKPAAVGADLQPALRYARAVLAGAERLKVVVFTDRNLGAPEREILDDMPFELRGVGRRGANAGITGFAVRRLRTSPADVEGLIALVGIDGRVHTEAPGQFDPLAIKIGADHTAAGGPENLGRELPEYPQADHDERFSQRGRRAADALDCDGPQGDGSGVSRLHFVRHGNGQVGRHADELGVARTLGPCTCHAIADLEFDDFRPNLYHDSGR